MPVVSYTKEIREAKNIGYGTVMDLAENIIIEGKNVRLKADNHIYPSFMGDPYLNSLKNKKGIEFIILFL